MTGALETHLRARRAEGAKLLVPYVTGGLSDDWTDVVAAVVAAGATVLINLCGRGDKDVAQVAELLGRLPETG